MRDADLFVFAELFREAAEKGFGSQLQDPLSESESTLLSNRILEETGLVIGWKSLKNYSMFVLRASPEKQENPTLATLDTLARYVLGAPRTDEIQRQRNESHFPYWFKYRESHPGPVRPPNPVRTKALAIGGLFAGAALIILLVLRSAQPSATERFEDRFSALQDDSLARRGWMVAGMDSSFWKRRAEAPGFLTLYTLRGDNWPAAAERPLIRNLLFREVGCECFSAEVHFSEFLPRKNWQQAGIVLLEDTSFVKMGVRLSVAYNDFSGGFQSSKEILIQAISSMGKGFENPEEVAHKTIFTMAQGQEALVAENLRYAALRIEKQGPVIRFLYSNGPMENSAFREVASREFPFQPRYVGIFALRGFVDDTVSVPVHISFFSLTCLPCGK